MMQAADTTARNEQLVLEFLDLMDRHQFDAVEEFLAPDFHLHFSGLQFDREQTLAVVRGVYESFADFRHEVQETFAAADWVILRIIDRATHTGTFEGVAATGRRIEVGQISIARVVDGKIVEIREEADLLGLMQQIGAVPVFSS
jgi:aspartyl-tRNA synthetase